MGGVNCSTIDATALLMCLQLEPRPEQRQLRETLLMLSSYFKML